MPKLDNRLYQIQALRAIAASAVVIYNTVEGTLFTLPATLLVVRHLPLKLPT